MLRQVRGVLSCDSKQARNWDLAIFCAGWSHSKAPNPNEQCPNSLSLSKAAHAHSLPEGH